MEALEAKDEAVNEAKDEVTNVVAMAKTEVRIEVEVPQVAGTTRIEVHIQPQTLDIRVPDTLTYPPSSPARSTGTGASPHTSAWNLVPAPGANSTPLEASNETGTSPTRNSSEIKII